jgi:hypothetical protein
MYGDDFMEELTYVDPTSKKTQRRKTDYKMPEKTYWHIYSLQTLNDEKFIKVVNKILKREYILIK